MKLWNRQINFRKQTGIHCLSPSLFVFCWKDNHDNWKLNIAKISEIARVSMGVLSKKLPCSAGQIIDLETHKTVLVNQDFVQEFTALDKTR